MCHKTMKKKKRKPATALVHLCNIIFIDFNRVDFLIEQMACKPILFVYAVQFIDCNFFVSRTINLWMLL